MGQGYGTRPNPHVAPYGPLFSGESEVNIVMKQLGSVRKIDKMGRIVIPKDAREQLNWDEGTSLEILTYDNGIFIRAYMPGCILCGEIKNVQRVNNVMLCEVHKQKLSA